jgi:hypothetical protein
MIIGGNDLKEDGGNAIAAGLKSNRSITKLEIS